MLRGSLARVPRKWGPPVIFEAAVAICLEVGSQSFWKSQPSLAPVGGSEEGLGAGDLLVVSPALVPAHSLTEGDRPLVCPCVG